jgi:hypothetical protein
MIEAGVQVISSGANVPFADSEIFYGPIMNHADEHLSLIPDFIANCGMARVFAYLMSSTNLELSDEGIFNDTSETIRLALAKIHNQDKSLTRISRTGLSLALEELM